MDAGQPATLHRLWRARPRPHRCLRVLSRPLPVPRADDGRLAAGIFGAAGASERDPHGRPRGVAAASRRQAAGTRHASDDHRGRVGARGAVLFSGRVADGAAGRDARARIARTIGSIDVPLRDGRHRSRCEPFRSRPRTSAPGCASPAVALDRPARTPRSAPLTTDGRLSARCAAPTLGAISTGAHDRVANRGASIRSGAPHESAASRSRCRRDADARLPKAVRCAGAHWRPHFAALAAIRSSRSVGVRRSTLPVRFGWTSLQIVDGVLGISAL